MQDLDQIEQFRRMTPQERWDIAFELAELGLAIWEQNLTPAEIARRWEVWRRDHDLSDQLMLEGFRRTR